MNNRLNDYCERFIQYREITEKAFYWTGGYTVPVCASILSGSDRTVSSDDLVLCRKMIKDKTGIFSNFRGTILEPMACMLAVADEPERLLEKALAAHDELRKSFSSSEYLPLVAMIIARLADTSQYAQIALDTRAIYNRMRKEHPFLTSAEDGPFAAMLLFSGKNEDEICDEAEKCYSLLSSSFASGNALQSLSHVLTLGEGTAQEKCGKFIRLYETIKLRGYRYGKGMEISALGALSILPVDVNTIADDIVAAADSLKEQKGYGFFGAGKTERLMHAAMIVGNSYVEANGSNTMNDTTLNCSITAAIAMIAAQQAAICSAIVAASVASSVSD